MKHLHLDELFRALGLMGRRKWWFLLSCTLSAVSAAGLVVLGTLMQREAVNAVVGQDASRLGTALIFGLVGLVCVVVGTPLTSYFSMYLSKRSLAAIRTAVFHHILKQPLLHFNRNQADLLSRLTNDLDSMGAIYDGQLSSAISHLIFGVVAMVTMWYLDLRLGVVVILLGLLTAWINALYAKPFRRIGARLQQQKSRATGRFLDLVAGNKVAKLFGIEEQVVARFQAENDQLAEAQAELARTEGARDAVDYLLTGASFLCIIGFGSYLVARGLADAGSVVAVFAIYPAANDLFTLMVRTLTDLQTSLAGAARVFELLDSETEALDQAAYRLETGGVGRPELQIDGVRFAYTDERGTQPTAYNLKVQAGQLQVISGPSGTGKTTFFRLLLGLHQPQAGTIHLRLPAASSVDPVTSLADWRQNFAYVPQDAYLFAGTIAENIACGRLVASPEEVRQAAREAGADDFICELPDGYDTQVGEGGARLSGGQRQRIALARALLKKAPVLLLDEATSALDAQTQAQVVETLQAQQSDRITLLISHLGQGDVYLSQAISPIQ